MGNIKEWYTSEFTTDELGKELSNQATFNELFNILDRGKNVYEYIGVSDSLIRERVFSKLSFLMECDYDYIYNQWLRADKSEYIIEL